MSLRQALFDALCARPEFSGIGLDQLRDMPAKGTAHGHVRLRLASGDRVARICYAHPGDPQAAQRLHTQAEAFRRLAPSGHVPRLYAVVEPSVALPGGVLIVEAIDGRVPELPGDLADMARSLASIHALPTPDETQAAPLPYLGHPVRALLAAIEINARFFAVLTMAERARQMLADEMTWARGFAQTHGHEPHPISPALADTHPGNFLVRGDGQAIFLDLEKAHYGSAAIDLAHASLPTSTRWEEEVDRVLNRGQTVGFHRAYFSARPAALPSLRPWLDPIRRMTLLRTLAFCARWAVQTQAPRDPADPGQWSDTGLEPHLRLRKRQLIADYFQPATLEAYLSEWHGAQPLNLMESL